MGTSGMVPEYSASIPTFPYPATQSGGLTLWLNQRHALETFRAFVGDEEGHKADCILAQWVLQPMKSGKAKHLTK